MAENPSFSVSVRQEHPKTFTEEEIRERVKIMADRALSSKAGRDWQLIGNDMYHGIYVTNCDLRHKVCLYEASIFFERKSVSGEAGAEMMRMIDFIRKKGSDGTFKPYVWEVVGKPEILAGREILESAVNEDTSQKISETIIDFSEAATWDDIEIPEVLLSGTDAEIEQHPAFQGLYGRGPHIRMMFSAIKLARDTEGRHRHHILLHGLPGAAKSSTFAAVQEVLPKGGFLKLNTNSMTKAGFEELFLKKLRNTGYPPIFFFEEIEKTSEEILNSLLSALDERAEIRKLNARTADRAEARFLGFATANDKHQFDKVGGGNPPEHPGALSSRFASQLYVPRPNRDQMRKILERDVRAIKGDERWIEPCLKLAEDMKENDPRRVQSWLAGGERLLTGKYQEDVKFLWEEEIREQRKA